MIIYTHRKGELAAARQARAKNPLYREATRLNRIAAGWQFDAQIAADHDGPQLRKSSHSGSKRAGITGTTQGASPTDRRSSPARRRSAAAAGAKSPSPASTVNRGPLPVR
jgi:hypothetical protein